MDDWRLAYEKTRQRMSQASIGLAICQPKGQGPDSDIDELCLIQETIAGDLLYQRFSLENYHQDETKYSLSSAEETRCREWIDACWQLECTESARDDGTHHCSLDLRTFLRILEENSSCDSSLESISGEDEREVSKKTSGLQRNTLSGDKKIGKSDLQNPSNKHNAEKTERYHGGRVSAEYNTNGFENGHDSRMEIDSVIDIKPISSTAVKSEFVENYRGNSEIGLSLQRRMKTETENGTSTEIEEPNSEFPSSSFFGFKTEKMDLDNTGFDRKSQGQQQQLPTEIEDSSSGGKGVDNIWTKLSKLKSENTFVTRSALGLRPKSFSKPLAWKILKKISSPVREDMPKPLSQCLSTNWEEDVFAPLEQFAPYIAFNEDFGMNMMKKKRR